MFMRYLGLGVGHSDFLKANQFNVNALAYLEAAEDGMDIDEEIHPLNQDDASSSPSDDESGSGDEEENTEDDIDIESEEEYDYV